MITRRGLKIVENAIDISEELRLLSPTVSSISRNTPYVIPDGYFNDLSDRVLDLIAASGDTASGVTASGDASSEDVHSALLAGVSKQSPYTLPPQYFEQFAQKILDHIKSVQAGKDLTAEKELEQLSPLLSGLRKSSPFRTPETYFTDLSTNVVSGVRAIEFVNDELENLSPLMNDLKSKTTYQAPANYFENLAELVLSNARQTTTQTTTLQTPSDSSATISGTSAKIIAMPARRAWWKYAAAAITAGLILTTGWLVFNKPAGAGNGNPDILKNLSRVSDQDIQNYLDNHNVPLTEAASTSTAALDMSDTDISDAKTLLGDVPDEELNKYLDEHGGTRDLATN